MKKCCAILAAAGCLAAGAACWAFDTVKTVSGATSGAIVGMSPVEVEVERGTLRKTVPVNKIVTIHYDDEPTQWKTARTHLMSGRYKDMLSTIERIDAAEVTRDVIEQDIAFYKALCAAKIALGGGGSIKEAGKQMMLFIQASPRNYHYFEACEMIGDLLTAYAAYSKAEEYYDKLAQAPWPDFKMRAGVALGRSRLAQNRIADAQRSFENVLNMDAGDESTKAQRLAAKLGIAMCLTAERRHDDAINAINAILSKADPEDVELNARAYNALGGAFRKAGRDAEARWAFLHVDLLYSAVPEAHAEALANLVELWTAMHKPERARRARRILDEQYKNSSWAKKGG